MTKPPEQYVSRAALKLASVSERLAISFKDKLVLDVGSSTGGFTDFALQHGARKIIAVEAGTDQLHRSLRLNPHIELHEQTDIRSIKSLSEPPDIIVVDVSFVSLRDILPHLLGLMNHRSDLIVMVKPQFEATKEQKNQGIIKNERVRREIFKSFEKWVRQHFLLVAKADSAVSGTYGNVERFYHLKRL